MIPLSRLYAAATHGVTSTTWLHHLGLMTAVQMNDNSVLESVRTDLGFTSLTMQPVDAEHPVRYLLGHDRRGIQVGLCSIPTTYPTAWPAAMLRGTTISPELAYKAMGYAIDNATIIAADLIPRLSADKEVIFFAHGLAAGVAQVLREKVRAAGKRASFLFQSSAPRVLTEASLNAITLPSARLQSLDDPFTVAPPASVMSDWRPTPGPFDPLYPMGPANLLPRVSTNRLRELIDAGQEGDAVSWTEGFTDSMLLRAAAGLYFTRMWASLSPSEQSDSIEWYHIGTGPMGLSLTRYLS